ncbi:MAG: alpha-amylase [Calditrichaeota bacterium]|nr:MAG: alpha-amylase [Calditrichota bacterium]
MKKILLIAFILLCTMNLRAQSSQKNDARLFENLHVPSPDWQDQVIYFLMIDRFNDGDKSNNDQGANEFDPADERKFSGGDIEGVIQKLDYIKELGATAVWITPPVANQWWDPLISYGGYHGYWAENFKKVDAHFGTLDSYKQLSEKLHQKGMYLIQDIVLNHTGNFFEYKGEYFSDQPARNFSLNQNSVPVISPSQYPFNLNDARNPAHRKANIYNWTPLISNYEDPYQRLYFQMAGLDDINTENQIVRDVLRDSYGYWIKEVGVDGFRIDTIIYVELDFWHDFMNSMSKQAPGINHVAAATGRENFIAFGETFIKSSPMQNDGDLQVAKYQGTMEKPALNSMLNYPLFYSMNRVFAQGMPTAYLGYRLNLAVNDTLYKHPFQNANFVDNHDWTRFIQGSKLSALKQALTFLFTIPGIPVIYQGTEQVFHESRSAMFSSGWKSGGKDHFDTKSDMFLFIKKLAKLRTSNKIFTRGKVSILQDSEVGPGVLAYEREYQGKQALVLFNTSDKPILMNNLKTGFPPGTRLKMLTGLGLKDDLIVGSKGRITSELPHRSAGVYLVSTEKAAIADVEFNGFISAENLKDMQTADFKLNGKITAADLAYQLIIDGNLQNSIPLPPDASGKWEAEISISRFRFGLSKHTIALYSPTQKLASEPLKFSTNVEIQGIRTVLKDAVNDDFGPEKNYLKPTHIGYTRQMDIEQVEVLAFGANLQIELTVGEISNPWLPPTGFDHALFHVFIDLPEQRGATQLPGLNAKAPADFEWNYAALVAGWHNKLYAMEGADAQRFGSVITPTQSVKVDMQNKKIILQFPPEALGNPATLVGAKIYITSWDSKGSEGGYRRMSKAGGPFEFGGTDDPQAPLILDDTAVIVIPDK